MIALLLAPSANGDATRQDHEDRFRVSETVGLDVGLPWLWMGPSSEVAGSQRHAKDQNGSVLSYGVSLFTFSKRGLTLTPLSIFARAPKSLVGNNPIAFAFFGPEAGWAKQSLVLKNDSLRLLLGVGFGYSLLDTNDECDGRCHLGGRWFVLSPKLEYMPYRRGLLGLGVYARAILPLSSNDTSGWGSSFHLGVTIGLGG